MAIPTKIKEGSVEKEEISRNEVQEGLRRVCKKTGHSYRPVLMCQVCGHLIPMPAKKDPNQKKTFFKNQKKKPRMRVVSKNHS